MGGPTRAVDLETDRVTEAIARAGLTGITAKQLAATTNLLPDEVDHRLERLVADRSIARHGRGLWALSRFFVGPPSPPLLPGSRMV